MTDALSVHLAAASEVDWLRPSADLTRRLDSLKPIDCPGISLDPHRRFIDKWDACDCPRRADRMRQALQPLSRWAADRRPVCWSMLEEVQRIVLGQEEVGFRCVPAWAKRGRECYGYWPGLKDEFTRKVVADDADGAHPVAKAVRLYLDICFFHPFADGNARAARLWFDFLLRRGGYSIAFLEPLFLVERFAGDLAAYIDFLRLATVSCARAHRRLSDSSCESQLSP